MHGIDKDWLTQQYVTENKSISKISREYGLDKRKIRQALDSYNIELHTQQKTLYDLTNQRFGRWTVIGDGECVRRGAYFWLCKCDCGTTKRVNSHTLRSGMSNSCGCLRKEMHFDGVGNLSKSYWNRIVHGAKIRNLSMNITIDFAWDLFEKQEARCALSGLPINLVRNYTLNHSDNTASLDRIDNNKGYEPDNVQWVHREINIMRGKLTVGRFLELCSAFTKHQESQ